MERKFRLDISVEGVEFYISFDKNCWLLPSFTAWRIARPSSNVEQKVHLS